MKMIRRKKPVPDMAAMTLSTVLSGFLRELRERPPEIRHRIIHEPRPRPTFIQPILRDQDGREYRTMPIDCTMRHTVPVYFPKGWLTGNPADAAEQCIIQLELHYDPRESRY